MKHTLNLQMTSSSSSSSPPPPSLPLSRFQSSLTCGVCRGYLIDATTITECMHTFCKSCLLQRIESGRTSCPSCGIQLQRSRLSDQLRLDHAVQALVYAAVPGLWEEEQRRRQHFVDHHPLSSSVAPPLQLPACFSPTDPISLSLDFVPSKSSHEELENEICKNFTQCIGRRYFRSPAAVTVHHFQKLLILKFELSPPNTVEIFCSGEKLDSTFRLMDVAYKTGWTQEEPLKLEYKIVRNPVAKGSSATSANKIQKMATSEPRPPAAATRPPPTLLTAKTTSSTSSIKASSVSHKRAGIRTKAEESQAAKQVVSAICKIIRRPIEARTPTPTRTPTPVLTVKKRGRKKRKRPVEPSPAAKADDTLPPLKVRIKSPEWTRPNGVELLVQAAALTALSPPPDQLNNNKQQIEDIDEGEGKLMIVDDDVINTSNGGSNGRDSGMANDEESDDSTGSALDLSSKSTRFPSPPPVIKSSPPPLQPPPSPQPQQRQPSPQHPRPSALLHSITDSLAQRQRLLQQSTDPLRNLLTLSQTAALVSPHLLAPSFMQHQLAAAAAAAAASGQSSSSYALLRKHF